MLEPFHRGRRLFLPFLDFAKATRNFPPNRALPSFGVISVTARLSGVLAVLLISWVALGSEPIATSRAVLLLCLLRYTREVVLQVRWVRVV